MQLVLDKDVDGPGNGNRDVQGSDARQFATIIV